MFRHLGGIQVRALLLYRAHGMPHNDGGMFQILIQGLGQEEIARNSHFVLILECDLLHADCLAGVKVVGPLGRALGKSRNAAEGQYAQHGGRYAE